MKLKVSFVSVLVSLFWLCLALGVQAADEMKPTRRVADALRILETKVNARGVPNVVGGILFFGKTNMNNDVAVVDALKAAKGCSASLFVKQGEEFIRVSTNVMSGNQRLVGTKLTVAPVIKALTVGESFYGIIDVVGSRLEVGYRPIIVDKKVIGALFVGFPVK